MTLPIINCDLLLLGSGMISTPLIDFLVYNKEIKYNINIASLDKNFLILLKNKYSNLKTTYIDIIKEKDELLKLIEGNSFVISLLPQSLQAEILKYCMIKEKSLLTTSEITEEISNTYKKYVNSLKKNNSIDKLFYVFECGCNPGLDHIISAKVIKEAIRKGSNIIEYENWSGAMPAPENTDNPILYKFSFSPLESLKGMVSNTSQLINNKIINIKEKELLNYLVGSESFHPSYNFEGYFVKNNTDNIKNYYSLLNSRTIITGSVRYKGFSFIIQAFKYLGLFSDNKINTNLSKNKKEISWRTFLSNKILNKFREKEYYTFQLTYINNKFKPEYFNINISSKLERYFYFRLTCIALSYFDYAFINKYNFTNLFNRLYPALYYFNFYNTENLLKVDKPVVASFFMLLENKIKMQEWERDMVYMKNKYTIKTFSGKIILKTFELILYGRTNDLEYTATSFLVGNTAGVITNCILLGKYNNLSNKEVISIPYDELIADEVLKNLAKKKVYLYEKSQLNVKF